MNFRSTQLRAAGLTLAASLLMTGCSKPTAAVQAQTKLNPIEIGVAAAQSFEVPTTLQATGTLNAAESAEITPHVAERVVSVPVKVGQHVTKGEILVQLDRTNFELRLRQALASEEQARAQVLQAESRLGVTADASFDVTKVPEVISARASADTAKSQAALADANAKRYAEVFKTGDVSQSAYDQAVQQARAGDDQVRMSEQQYISATNTARQNFQMVAGARASLANAEVQVAIARGDLDNTAVKAPFDGYVSDIPVGLAQLVGPTIKVATLVQIDTLKGRLQVPEENQGQVRNGLKIVAHVAAYPDRDFAGTITAIDPAIDSAARSITILADIPNAGGILRPGMFVSAQIELPQPVKLVYVPADAVMTQPGSNTSSVFVVEGQAVVQKLVRVAARDSRGVGISSGLDPGAKVAVGSNLPQLFDGATITLRSRS